MAQRPDILFPLFVDTRTLKGVGPRIEKLVERVAGPKVVDLLWTLPTGVIDRSHRPKIGDAAEGELATMEVRVEQHQVPRNPRVPYRVRCTDDTGVIDLVFFRGDKKYLQNILPIGETRIISGKVDLYRGEPQMTHPDHVLTPDEFKDLPPFEAVYPLTAGLTQKTMAKAVSQAVARISPLPEWQDAAWLKQQDWQSWHDALATAHQPEALSSLDPMTPARQRLAYDELLANQLALGLVRSRMKRLSGRVIKGDGALRRKVLDTLPFDLTGSQKGALKDINADMASDMRMLRMLQGDVGSGKTVVALLAMLNAVEAGKQAALMAPTEILARQHMESIAPLAEAAGVRVALLTGRDKGKVREAILAQVADGSLPILIGTHALFQDDVVFKDLGLAVVDEQHRFGVHQRLMLSNKGQQTDVLVMTATPIPRTLTLTIYGDMDSSQLRDKPPGRKPIETRVLPNDRLEDVVGHLQKAVDSGARAYWVCPLVEDSDVLDVTAAEERFRHLSATLKAKVGLVHGRMKGPEKDAVMADFQAGRLNVLVATTVIEVGVNVPEATIMIIEHAERFGLAQLHQLRGRVGRGDKPSSCLLLYQSPLGEVATARLKIMRETEDGFLIAEEDLRLRGSGELLGTRQSGLPVFRLADLSVHGELLAAARDDAVMILEKDPDLTSPRGEALRILLYLFERDEAVKRLRSG